MTPADLAEISERNVAVEMHTHRHRAPEDPDEFAEEVRINRLYDEGLFTPTIGLVLWPRADMLRWWRGHPAFAVVEAA